MNVKVYVVSAFTKDNKGGNKAGVVLFDDRLNDKDKREISRKLGYSETVFVTKSTQADFKLEYFTPTEEVPLCGHATIATFALMEHLNILDRSEYTFETKSGVLSVTINKGMVYMEQTKPEYFEILKTNEFVDCFDRNCLSEEYPIQIVSTGLPDIIIPIKDEDTLNAMNPNFENITEASKKYKAVGIHAFVISDDRIICRNFAPLYDIPEESATGTANCALASYLHKHNILRKDVYTMEQGYSLDLPSEIIVKLTIDEGSISRIFVGGYGSFLEELDIRT